MVDSRSSGTCKSKGFTLVELMVSMAITVLLLLLLLTITSQTTVLFRYTSGRIEQFRGAREAFESMTSKLSQATLNTYWDYNSLTAPTNYVRQSELRFITGNTSTLVIPPAGVSWPTQGVFFQAPLGFMTSNSTPSTQGLENLLNTWGYFIEYGSDAGSRPSIISSLISPLKYRFRLYELMQPANLLSVYTYTSGTNSNGTFKNLTYTGKDWFSAAMLLPDPPAATPNRPVHVLAENIIALIILPKLATQEEQSLMLTPVASGGIPTATLGTSLAPQYSYDSTSVNATYPALNPKNQLPPILQVTMVAIDEASAKRIASGATMPNFNLSALFQVAANYSSDLTTLQGTLNKQHISYRVFTTNVIIKGAEWSRDETN